MRWALCPYDAHYSCRRFGDVEIRQRLNANIDTSLQMPAQNLHVPDPNAPDAYEALIEHLGGIDMFLLASGRTDGHVAFNPQGCALQERTRVIELSEATRRDNLDTFPNFRALAEVPRHGVSVGPATIARHSRAALLMLLGAGKAAALQRVTSLIATIRIGPPASYWNVPTPRSSRTTPLYAHQLLRSCRNRTNTSFGDGSSGRSGNASRNRLITLALVRRKNVLICFSSPNDVTRGCSGS